MFRQIKLSLCDVIVFQKSSNGEWNFENEQKRTKNISQSGIRSTVRLFQVQRSTEWESWRPNELSHQGWIPCSFNTHKNLKNYLLPSSIGLKQRLCLFIFSKFSSPTYIRSQQNLYSKYQIEKFVELAQVLWWCFYYEWFVFFTVVQMGACVN